MAVIEYEPNSPGRPVWLVSRKTGEARHLSRNSKIYDWVSAANGKLFAVETIAYSYLNVVDFAENFKSPQIKQVYSEPGLIEDIIWSTNDKIFYNSWASGKNEIWQISPDGTMPKQLTKNSNLTQSFTVSPVDGKLVFAAQLNGRSSLFMAEADGSNIRQLTDGNDTLPRFMPDGKEVIFQKGSLIKPTLWRISTDKNQLPKQITGYKANHPTISPDGKTIAYQFMDYNSEDKVWKLGLMDSANGRLLNKIDFPFPITERKTIWHPGGNLLTMIFKNGESSGFLLLSPKNNSYQTIENVTTEEISSFAWSPDGKRLAYTLNFETSDVVILDE